MESRIQLVNVNRDNNDNSPSNAICSLPNAAVRLQSRDWSANSILITLPETSWHCSGMFQSQEQLWVSEP
jgi:hypothetical protein